MCTGESNAGTTAQAERAQSTSAFRNSRIAIRILRSAIFSLLILTAPPSVFSQTSPGYRLSASPDLWLAPASIGALIVSSTIPADPPELTPDELARMDIASIPLFDRPATHFRSMTIRAASDISLALAVVAPVIVLTEFDHEYLDLLAMYVETISATTALTNLAKLSGRIRPLAYNDDVPMAERMDPEMRRSFFSGHSSVSMAAGVFLASVYERHHPGTPASTTAWAGGIGLGLLTGSLRVFSGMHFPSDVLVGAVVGAAIGFVVPKMHESVENRWDVVLRSGSARVVTIRIPL